jgi:hypothetical protein
MALGVVILILLGFIPVLGGLVAFVAILLGSGAFLRSLRAVRTQAPQAPAT